LSENGYYQNVEEFFVSKRGDPLFLSSSDWVLVHKWRCQGIPLRIVLRGIADAFEGHSFSWSRDRKVGSLSYCRREVEAARDRWQHAIALGAESSDEPSGRLRSLAQGLEAASGLDGPAGGLAKQAAREMRRLAEAPLDRRTLESWLQAREAELVAALAEAAGPEALAAHRASVERDLSAYRDRMPAKVLEQIRTESLARLLFERWGLPRLSLLEP
jgi:hypothetical protein